jgi:hypothetical protein
LSTGMYTSLVVDGKRIIWIKKITS